MEKLYEVVISLNSNYKEGRYILKVYSYPVQKETDKTIIVSKKHGDYRFLKNEILKIQSKFRNDKLNALRFSTICAEEQLVEAQKMLEEQMSTTVDELILLNKLAAEAFEQGPIIKNV